MKGGTKFHEFAYWSILLFCASIAGYIVVTLINAATVEDTTMLQSRWVKKQVNRAVLETSYGDIAIVFDRRNAPIAVSNFADLVRSSFYDGTKFHRVEKDLLIAGGDPLSRESDKDLWGTGGPGYVFEDEIGGQKVERGVVGMLHPLGRPDTNGSQFFILVAEKAPEIEGNYTIFGKVVSGMDVVDRIASAKTDDRNIPIEAIYLHEAYLE